MEYEADEVVGQSDARVSALSVWPKKSLKDQFIAEIDVHRCEKAKWESEKARLEATHEEAKIEKTRAEITKTNVGWISDAFKVFFMGVSAYIAYRNYQDRDK